MKKRIISLALCFLLVFSHVLPVAAVDSSEPACSGSCEDTTSAATHTADCAVYAYYESMSAKGAQHMYENWDAISESDRANLLIWLDAHNPDMAAELRALLTPAAEESTPTETTVPAEPQPAVEEKTLESGEFSVTGKDIPDGAELIIGEFPMPYSADTPAVSMYNIKVYDGDEVWQPANGETVEVSIPVSDPDAETVNVVHFLEDPDKIRYALENGLAQAIDVTCSEEAQYLFEGAVTGYQEAFNTDATWVVIEAFENVPVSDGKVSIDANGFSVFTSYPPDQIDEAGNSFFGLPDTVYVRPGEWARFSTSGIISYIDINSDPYDIADKLSGENFAFLGTSDVYFHVSDDAQPRQYFNVDALSISWGGGYRNVRFEVVKDFDYGKVRICVLPKDYTGYPNELSEFTNVGFNFYTNENTLTSANSVYTMYPRTLIDVNNLKKSDHYVSNDSKTVYGISDSTGALTSAYLTDDFDAISENILKAYYGDNRENYKLIVYAVKYEAVGDNVGWYINCKPELKSNFILSYNYNAPSPLTEFDIGDTKKPSAQSIPTYDADGNPLETVTATVASGSGMVLSRTIDTTAYKAEFVGWNTNPNADANEENKTTENGWYGEGDTITMYGDTTLYAIWKLSWKPTIADVDFQKLVVDESGAIVTEPNDTFSFTVSSNFAGTSYKIYTSDGITQISSGTFAADALTFNLENGQYIVISDVPNDNSYSYTITETAIEGYTPQTGSYTHSFNITDDSNTSGKLSYDFYNVLKKYSVTYLDGVDDEEIEIPAAQEKIYGTDLVLSSEKPVRTGYEFTGWLGSDNKPYQPGGTYTGNAALTLTAQWKLKTYTVTYNTDGGTGKFADQTKEYGIALTLHSDVPVKEGYSFSGWLGNDGNTYQPGDTYTGNAALTLTAQWKAVVADLTIKTVLNASAPYADQNFVFIVEGEALDTEIGKIYLEVALDGTDTVVIGNMPAGTYTVTEKSGWTWRYNGIQSAEAIVDSDGAAVTFTFGEPGNKLWLSGYHYGKK